MNYSEQPATIPFANVKTVTWKGLIGSVLLAGSVCAGHAQGEIGLGTVAGSGSGPYTYSLTFSDAANATAPIGSVWYAWIPGGFFLPSAPTSVSAPAGWTATPSFNSIQFAASSAANYIAPGGSLSGFGFTATFSPAQLAAAPNSGRSFAYKAGIEGDPGNGFTVLPVQAPEPSSLMLISGAAGVFLVWRRKVSMSASSS